MVYVIWIAKSDTEYLTNFLYGDEREIMNALIDNAEMLIDALGDGMDLDELEGEYYCDFDDYKKFQDTAVPVTIADLQSYSFTLSDCTDYLLVVASEFDEFVSKFNEDSPLEDVVIRPGITEDDVEDLASDIESYGYADDEYEWLVPIDED